VVEYTESVVQTNSLPERSFKQAFLYAWAVQAFHCFGLTQHLSLYCRFQFGLRYRFFYERLVEFANDNPGSLLGDEFQKVSRLLDSAVEGGGWGIVLPQFGDVVWPTEEATFLTLVCNKDRFYSEISKFLGSLLSSDGGSMDEYQVNALLTYQKSMIIDPFTPSNLTIDLGYNFHEYFEGIYQGAPRTLEKSATRLAITPEWTFDGDLELYARTVVWYGRKSNKFRHTNVRETVLV
jgi:hypothetical protein